MSSAAGLEGPLETVPASAGRTVQPSPETRYCWVWCYEVARQWLDLEKPLDAAVQLWLLNWLRPVLPDVKTGDVQKGSWPEGPLTRISFCTGQNSDGSVAHGGSP